MKTERKQNLIHVSEFCVFSMFVRIPILKRTEGWRRETNWISLCSSSGLHTSRGAVVSGGRWWGKWTSLHCIAPEGQLSQSLSHFQKIWGLLLGPICQNWWQMAIFCSEMVLQCLESLVRRSTFTPPLCSGEVFKLWEGLAAVGQWRLISRSERKGITLIIQQKEWLYIGLFITLHVHGLNITRPSIHKCSFSVLFPSAQSGQQPYIEWWDTLVTSFVEVKCRSLMSPGLVWISQTHDFSTRRPGLSSVSNELQLRALALSGGDRKQFSLIG